jgi:hypothetical protein
MILLLIVPLIVFWTVVQQNIVNTTGGPPRSHLAPSLRLRPGEAVMRTYTRALQYLASLDVRWP